MNDERLIQLLRETPPEDLSRDEIHELRRRLPQSGELRQALFEHLQLDQALSETLGGVNLSPDSIARRATTVISGGAGRLFGWGTISALLLGLLGVGVLIAARWDRQPRPVAARAVADSDRKVVRARSPKQPVSSVTQRPALQTPPATIAEPSDQAKQPSMAAVELPNSQPATAIEQPEADPPRSAPRWFEPLIDVHNEAYNAVAELSVALRHQEWRDVCRVIVATRPEEMNGLAPDPADPERLTTVAALIGQAMHEHAELRQAFEEEYGGAAWQRFRQAADEDEAAGVEAVAIGLPGTAAAGDAQRWLGDRALAAGRFRHALAQYRAAARGAASGPNDSLAARVRFAAALLGRDLGSPPEESFEFDGQQLSPAEFEQLVAEMRSRAPAGRTDCVEPFAPPPGNYTPRIAVRFDDGGPHDPGAMRPIRLARAASGVIVSSGYSVAAFNPADGNRRWLFSLAEAGKAPTWPAEPMNPLVVGSAVYVRVNGTGGPELVSLSVDTGQPLWKDRSLPRVACDPLLIDDRFIICQWHDDVAGRRRIDLATLDIATGRANERLRLAWLSGDSPSARCTLTAVEDSLVFVTADVLIATDLRGRPRWARRIDAPDVPPHGTNSAEPPWIGPGAGCVYCYQPVEGKLQSIELSTGREHWRRVIGPARRIIAVGTEGLAVQTDDGVNLYDAHSGETRWHFTVAAHAFVAAAPAEPPTLVLVEAVPTEVPRLRWLDLISGQPNGESVLAGLPPGPGSLTPCSTAGAGFWLARRDPAAKTVELIELHAK